MTKNRRSTARSRTAAILMMLGLCLSGAPGRAQDRPLPDLETERFAAGHARVTAHSLLRGHIARKRAGRMEQYRALADELERELLARGVPGGALAIVERNRVQFATGLGMKEAGGSAEVDADTRFRIGSITKTFTAALAAQLASERVLSLDAPITRYLPELALQPPHDPSRITLRQLLSHTSGIPDYTELSCETGDDALEAWFADHPNLTLWTPPGRLFSYSNLGYSLAGLVLERAAGAPYRQLVEELIVEPLALDSMTYEVAEALAGNHARGLAPEADDDPASIECGLVEPAGYLWSSARDLGRFAATLLRWGDGVLDVRTVARMRAPHAPLEPGSSDVSYGLGLVSIQQRGVRIVGHDGGLPGYSSAMWLVPELDVAVVLLANGNVDANQLAFAALFELLDLPEEPPPDRTTPPSAWVDYVGVYDEQQEPTAFPEPWIGTVVVELENDTLFMRDVGDSERLPMEQVADDTWIVLVDDTPIMIRFWRDRMGRVEYIASRYGALRRVADLE